MRLCCDREEGDREEGDKEEGDGFEQGQPSPPPPCSPSPAGRRVQDAPCGPSPAPDGSSGPQTPLDRQQGAPVPKPAQQTGRPPGEGTTRSPVDGRGTSCLVNPQGSWVREGNQEPAQTGVPHTCGHVPTLTKGRLLDSFITCVCLCVRETDRQGRERRQAEGPVPGQAPGPLLWT